MQRLFMTTALAGLVSVGAREARAQDRGPLDLRIPPDEKVISVPPDQATQLKLMDIEVDTILRLPEARRFFRVTGAGIAVVVIDSGLRRTHRDFAGRVPAWKNFTDEGAADDVTDGNGHGTNVAGIVAASGRFAPVGVAPEASVIPLKVLRADGSGSFEWTLAALDWTIANAKQMQIGAVSMSLGNSRNYKKFAEALAEPGAADLFRKIGERVDSLTKAGTLVVIAAGNDYFRWKDQGMSFPAIIPESISVGAVYDSVIPGPLAYQSGAMARTTGPDRLTPFTQRLNPIVDEVHATDVFAPGAPITSTGADSDDGLSVQSGTSQATPVISGVVLLVQDYFVTHAKRRPTAAEVLMCLKAGSEIIIDGDDEDDNVPHRNERYGRASAMKVLAAARVRVNDTATKTKPMALDMTGMAVKLLREQNQIK